MFDDLRNESKKSEFESDDLGALLDARPKVAKKSVSLMKGGKIFGMNAMQRFILSFLLFAVVCLAGMMVLVVTEKVLLF
jgi:hypothetical protein